MIGYYNGVISRVADIRNQYDAARNEILSNHPAFDKNKDIRINIFSKCINVFDATHLSLIFYSHHLQKENWWRQTATKLSLKIPPEDDRKDLLKVYLMFIKIGFVQTFVSSALESSIRTIISNVNPMRYKKEGWSFEGAYHLLLAELNQLESKPLLDILRCIRNTNHDNGVYYGKNETIPYKGNIYEFKNEESVEFVSWDFILSMAKNAKELILSIVKSKGVLNIENMNDTSSPYYE
jgi:hypothetical protein